MVTTPTGPVSYTHLDVYKRQVPPPVEREAEIGHQRQSQQDNEQDIQSTKASSQPCLLYTSRDALLIVLSLLLPLKLGVNGIFWAAPVADTAAFIITAFVMVRLWRKLSHSPAHAQADGAAVLQPVSYTHLDVYKRQVFTTVTGSASCR